MICIYVALEGRFVCTSRLNHLDTPYHDHGLSDVMYRQSNFHIDCSQACLVRNMAVQTNSIGLNLHHQRIETLQSHLSRITVYLHHLLTFQDSTIRH